MTLKEIMIELEDKMGLLDSDIANLEKRKQQMAKEYDTLEGIISHLHSLEEVI